MICQHAAECANYNPASFCSNLFVEKFRDCFFPTDKEALKKELIRHLLETSTHMKATANFMIEIGSSASLIHGRELRAAAEMTDEWIRELLTPK